MKQAKWKALIADDEPAARRGVRQLLANFPEFVVAGECRNGAEVLAALETSAPDVVFLDIQMPGIDGFEVIKRRTVGANARGRVSNCFRSVCDQGFRNRSARLSRQACQRSAFCNDDETAVEAFGSTSSAPRDETIVVTTSRGATVLHLNEIDWIEAAGNYTQLWIGTRSYFLRESLQLLEERAQKHGFIRAHRRALVRLDGVRELSRTRAGASVAVLESGARIPVSRRRSASFIAALRESAKPDEG